MEEQYFKTLFTSYLGTVFPFTQAGVKNLAEHRYMCIEDDTTHRRVVILQADQTVTGNSMDLEYAHDAAIATCIRNFNSVVCTMYLHYCVANSCR